MNLIYFHIGDYAQATARLTPEQDGIYWRLLMEYYKTEKAPVDDLAKLGFLVGCQTRRLQAELKFILEHFFVHDAEKKCWFHKRVEREIAGYRLDGVQKRYAILCRHWEKANPGVKKPTFEEYSASPTRYYDEATGRIRVVTGRKVLVLESYGDGSTDEESPNYAPVPSTQEPVPSTQGTTPEVPTGTSSLEAFAESIYQLYPRKEKKKKGVAAIIKAMKEGTVTELELTEAVRAYAEAVETWPVEERRFIPLPASWFNGGCWSDDRSNWTRTPSPEKKEKGGAGSELFALGKSAEPKAPRGWERAMPDLFGEEWREMYAAWALMPPADQRQVRVWLAKNEGGGLPPKQQRSYECPTPCDWQEVWAEVYGELPAPQTWAGVSDAARRRIVARIEAKKKKMGATEA